MANGRKENDSRPPKRTKLPATAEEEDAPARPLVRAVARAPRPNKCRTFARAQVAKAMPELVDALLERSAEGSLGHMRLLVQLSGLDEAEPAKRRRGKSLVRTLLDDWRSTGETQ